MTKKTADEALKDPKNWHEATRLVHGGTLRSQFGEMSEALFLTQGFVYDTAEAAEARFNGQDPGFIYSRYSNPTIAMFEERMCLLEGAEAARATASGMAAVTAALLGQLKAGDHLVSARALFGSCLYVVEELLPRFGIAATLVDGADLDQWRGGDAAGDQGLLPRDPDQSEPRNLRPESHCGHRPPAWRQACRRQCLCLAGLAEALQHGADCVVYSTTKHIDGQGRCLGGIILSSREFIDTYIHTYLRQTGPALSPFNAWVMLKSLETLPLRVNHQSESAARIADFLATQANVKRLLYPGRADHPQAALARRQ